MRCSTESRGQDQRAKWIVCLEVETATDSFSDPGDDESTKSYGAGIRFEVLPAKRPNMRLDFARSDDDPGIYPSVGEAFWSPDWLPGCPISARSSG